MNRHEWHDFRKNVTEHKICGLIFSVTFIWNVSHSKKNLVWCSHKYENVFVWSTSYSCRILIKLEFSRQMLEKSLNIKFHQNLSCGNWVVLCGRMNGRTDERTKLTVAFRNSSKARKNGKFVPVHDMKACTGRLEILSHSFLGEWSASHSCRLTFGKEPLRTWGSLRGPQSRPGHFLEEKIIFSFRDTKSNPPARRLVSTCALLVPYVFMYVCNLRAVYI
jgi:hypothetical protein